MSFIRSAMSGAVASALILFTGSVAAHSQDKTATNKTHEIPTFQVDASWPKLPSKWVLGLVSGVNVDGHDHIWVLQRPRTVKPGEESKAAPPVLEFDIAGNFIQGWGGPGEGYEWPTIEHGISVDDRGYVWIGGSNAGEGRPNIDDQILKFTQDGKFVMQIGHAGKSTGNTDTVNVSGPADVTVWPKTNEVFVADGYGNRRVIVFDATTGKFKRMWGAFGNVPTDPPPSTHPRRGAGSALAGTFDGPGADQFENVHSARVSNDGLVYVSDRSNKRVQVFTLEGKYVTQVFIDRVPFPPSTLTGTMFGKPLSQYEDGLVKAGMTASRTAFSPDPQQRYLYVLDRIRQQIAILDRKSLTLLGYVGDGIGTAPGQFYIVHDIAADSKGNIYTAEVNDDGNRRAQKFTFKGMKPLPAASK